MRRQGRRDKTPQTTIRVSIETRDRLKALLTQKTRELNSQRPWLGRQYGETALVTMDDIVRELLRHSKAPPAGHSAHQSRDIAS